MPKIVIIGISGTGKSALGRKLATKFELPLFHMDTLIWRPDWVESPVNAIEACLSDIVSLPNWIVEGWIDSYSIPMLLAADVVVYLDYPGWLAALGGLQRWLQHRGGRKRPEMPDGCHESFNFDFIKTMLRKERSHIETTLDALRGLHVLRVTSRRSAKDLIGNSLLKET